MNRISVARAGLLVLSSMVSILLVEAAFRVYETHFLIHEEHLLDSSYDLKRYRYNDLRGVLSPKKREDEYRILSFGDSFAKAITKPLYTYTSVLERNLAPVRSGADVSIVNLGLGGTSFPEYVSQFKIWSSNVEFDAVIFNLYAGNDFRSLVGTLFQPDQKNRFRARDQVQVLTYGPGTAIPQKFFLRIVDYLYAAYHSFVSQTADSQFYSPGILELSEELYFKRQASMTELYQVDRLENFSESFYWLYKLMKLASDLTHRGIPVAITVAPPHFITSEELMSAVMDSEGLSQEQLVSSLPAAIVKSFADRLDFRGRILDLTPCLSLIGRTGVELYYGTNTHWNVAGNQIVGRILASELSSGWAREAPNSRVEPWDCDTSIPPLSPKVLREIDSFFDQARVLVEIESQLVEPLRSKKFSRIEDVYAELKNLGYRSDPERVRGKFTGFGRSRTVGTSRPQGWVLDEGAPEKPLFVMFFNRGHLVGMGRATGWHGSRREGGGLVAEFDFQISARGSDLVEQDKQWVVALAEDGRFSVLERASQDEF